MLLYNFDETDGTLEEIDTDKLIERAYEREEAQAESEQGQGEMGEVFGRMTKEEMDFWDELAEEEEKADRLLWDKIMALGEEE